MGYGMEFNKLEFSIKILNLTNLLMARENFHISN